MNVETVEISTLCPDPANVRRHSERNIETIKASLRRFGQQKPVVVDANGIVRAGNGTVAAAVALGCHLPLVAPQPPESQSVTDAGNQGVRLTLSDGHLVGGGSAPEVTVNRIHDVADGF